MDGDPEGVAEGASLATTVGSADGDPDGVVVGAKLGVSDGAMYIVHGDVSSQPLLLFVMTPGSEFFLLQSNMFSHV